MKSQIILPFILLFAIKIYGQTDSTERSYMGLNNSYMGFAAGWSLPYGDFENADFYKETSGLALKGFYFNAFYAFASETKLKLETGLHITINQLNSVIDAELQKVTYPSNQTYDYAYGDWFSSMLMLGPSYRVPLKDISFVIKAQGGLMIATKPYLVQRLYSGGVMTWEFLNEKATGIAPAFLADASLWIHFNKKVSLRVFGGLSLGKPEFTLKYRLYSGNYSYKPEEKAKMMISTYNFGLGLVYSGK